MPPFSAVTCFMVELAGRRPRGENGTEQWLRNPATQEEYSVRDAPAGAMFYADWFHAESTLAVKCPNGRVWAIDIEYAPGQTWVRSGDPPHVTATPSILIGDYHGWLRDGVLLPV